jgi:hypothetical protein
MKRIFVLPLLAAALVFSASAAWGAAPTEPPASLACLDITSGSFDYAGTTLTGSIGLAAPICKQATYTLYVEYQDSSGATQTSAIPFMPTVNPSLVQIAPTNVADDDGTICVYATSSIGGRVFDIGAPDNRSCLTLVSDTGPPATQFH